MEWEDLYSEEHGLGELISSSETACKGVGGCTVCVYTERTIAPLLHIHQDGAELWEAPRREKPASLHLPRARLQPQLILEAAKR